MAKNIEKIDKIEFYFFLEMLEWLGRVLPDVLVDEVLAVYEKRSENFLLHCVDKFILNS